MKSSWKYIIISSQLILPLFTTIVFVGCNADITYTYLDINCGDYKSVSSSGAVIGETPFSKEVRRLGIEIPKERISKFLSARSPSMRESSVYNSMYSEAKMLILILETFNVPDKERIHIIQEVLKIFKMDVETAPYKNDIDKLTRGIYNKYHVEVEDLLRSLSFNMDINDFDIQQHAQLASKNLKNDTVDPEPILFAAKLFYDMNDMTGKISFAFCDEDFDVIGLGITERHIEDDVSQTILTEEYPFYTWVTFVYKVESHPLPLDVRLRDTGQHKNEEQWQQYTNDESNSERYYLTNLPDIWISIPEPNKVEVEVYIYDRAGHKSDPVKLRYEPKY